MYVNKRVCGSRTRDAILMLRKTIIDEGSDLEQI